MGKVFPQVVGERTFPTRQEVFYFGVPNGEKRFAPPAMPVCICITSEEMYSIPDLEGRGFKVAHDRRGAAFDPDSEDRVVTREGLAHVRNYLARRFPAMKDAPVVETRVCQYENTWNGDFLIDRHPELENVWLVGGGSGHGFKHGPAVGEYVAQRVMQGGPTEERFALWTKDKKAARGVY
jgi:glycine/D-amino acid oxidase-like deaminating enzyme